MKIADQTVVSMHFSLKNGDGELIDSSEGQEPLSYLHGAGSMVPGLEQALEDKAAGDEFSVVVSAEQGYGDYRDDLIQQVPLAAFEGVDRVEVGAQFEAQGEGGQNTRVTVTAVEDDVVIVDANHPLAGQELHFDIKVTEVRAASQSEIDHGHVH